MTIQPEQMPSDAPIPVQIVIESVSGLSVSRLPAIMNLDRNITLGDMYSMLNTHEFVEIKIVRVGEAVVVGDNGEETEK
jgi:hypothetical protein